MINNPVIPNQIGNFTNVYQSAGALSTVIQVLVNVALGLGGLIFFFMLILGAYEYMTSGGDKEATQKASKRITMGVVGLLILFSIFAIILVINAIFGFDIGRPIIPTIGSSAPAAASSCSACGANPTNTCPGGATAVYVNCSGLDCWTCSI